MKAIVIISYSANYGWNSIINCYNSIRNIDKNIIIIIVNNYNEPPNTCFINDFNCRYFTNSENSYELGAIKLALYYNPDIEYFYIVHDSCIFKNNIPFFTTNTIFWKTTIMDISPAIDIIKNWCNNYFPYIQFNNPNAIMCQGLMGYFSKNILLEMFNKGLNKIKVTSKIEAVASEGMFGILLMLIDSNISSYYKYKLNTYISNNAPFDSIIKLAGGKDGFNRSYFFNIFVDNNSIAHTSYKFNFTYNNNKYDSLENCLINNTVDKKDNIIFEYLKQNTEALNILTQGFPCSIIIDNDTCNLNEFILRKIHYLFTLKHFNISEYSSD